MRRLPEEGAGAEERSLWMPAKARMESPSEPQEKMQSCQHPDFSPVKLILGF